MPWFLIVALSLACAAPPASAPAAPPATMTPNPAAETAIETVGATFPPPAGATRIPTDAFGASLVSLPLRPAGTPVRTHDGRIVPIAPVRVVDLPLVRGDLQQCADTAIRLRAEWLRDQGRPVLFHATSGDPIPWQRVRGGEIPYAEGRGLKWRAGTADWDQYLRLVFTWAGTASLVAHDTDPADAPRAGDLLVEGGFPGHALVVLDAVRRGDETLLLLGQGFMPAQDLHVIVGPVDGWWPWTDPLVTPSWTFERTHLRRWREG